MNQDDDAVRRKQRRTKAGDEPHHASRRGAKKKRSLAWYQHLSIVIPLAACVIFAVLIGGMLTVRRIIYQVAKPAEQVSASPVSEVPTVESPPTSVEYPVVAETPVPTEQPPPQPTEVGAPLADQKPGMKLSKTLLVGPGQGMLPTICDALNVAEPGDVIEVRTNGPLLEVGTQLLRKTRVADAPIIVRNGDGFQPVVRMGKVALLAKTKNVDLAFSGLHFVMNHSPTLLWIEQGNVSLSDCSITRAVRTSEAVILINPNGADFFQATFDRCFLRNVTFGMQAGARLSFIANECGCITLGGRSHFVYRGEAENLVEANRCTFLDGNIVSGSMTAAQWPAPPLKYRLNQSICGVSMISPILITISRENRATNEAQALALFESWVAFEGEGSVRQLYTDARSPTLIGRWASIDGFNVQDASRYPQLPKNDATLKFGSMVEEMRQFRSLGKHSLAADLGWQLLPDQLAVSSTGALAELRAAGVQVGCEVTRLPVPPPATLELYPAVP
jgi:hypothetical protein